MRHVPAGLIEQQQGMPPGGNPAGDLGQMQANRLRVAQWQGETDQKTVRGTHFLPNARALAVFRADRAKEAGGGGTRALREGGLLLRLAPKSGPSPGVLVLLTNAGLIGKPHLYPVWGDGFFLRDGLKPCRDRLFKILVGSGVSG